MKPKLVLFAVAWIAGCAAHTAAERGATVEEIARCRTEACVLGYGPQVLKAYTPRPEGDRDVLYLVRRAASPVREFVRPGMKDRSPPAAFESVAEPMEGHASSGEAIVFKVSYGADGRIIQVSVQNSR
jgi:hypothetical protein